MDLSPVLIGALLSAIVSIPLTIVAVRRLPFEQRKLHADTDLVKTDVLSHNFAALTALHDQLEAALSDRSDMKRRMLEQEDTLVGMQSQIRVLQMELGLLKEQKVQDGELLKAERLIRQRLESELSLSREMAVKYEIQLKAIEAENERLQNEEG